MTKDDKYAKRKKNLVTKVKPKSALKDGKLGAYKEKGEEYAQKKMSQQEKRPGAKMRFLGKDGKYYPDARAKATADRAWETHVGSKRRQGEYVKPGTEQSVIKKGETISKLKSKLKPGQVIRKNPKTGEYYISNT